MSNYRGRPKGNYIHETTWKELFILTESWRSILSFYTLEIQFLETLIETYFVKLLLYEELSVLQELQKDLLEVKKDGLRIQKQIQLHSDQIVDIIDEPFGNNVTVFRSTHEKFEDEISAFKVRLEILIYTVFKITKNVLDDEKPKSIWKYN